jgi:hypothetical protein
VSAARSAQRVGDAIDLRDGQIGIHRERDHLARSALGDRAAARALAEVGIGALQVKPPQLARPHGRCDDHRAPVGSSASVRHGRTVTVVNDGR